MKFLYLGAKKDRPALAAGECAYARERTLSRLFLGKRKFARVQDASSVPTATYLQLDRHTDTQVVIIGAGPAGLGVAQQLKKHGVDPLLLEKGDSVGQCWRDMPTNLKLLTRWQQCCLPNSPPILHPTEAFVSARCFAQYLQNYAAVYGLRVANHTHVARIEALPGGRLQLHTSDGKMVIATSVVNATGYYSKPFLPSFEGANESAIPHIHFVQYTDPARIAQDLGGTQKRVLVVGKGISAGQVINEMEEAGFAVEISVRGPIKFGLSPQQNRLLTLLLPVTDWLRQRLGLVRNLEMVIEGGRTEALIESGKVPVRANIRKFESDTILFEDGQREKYDLVIYATGFREAVNHLRGAVEIDPASESPNMPDIVTPRLPGLHFIGVDGHRTFCSRFLRGIHQEAVDLARAMAKDLSEGTNMLVSPRSALFGKLRAVQRSLKRHGIFGTLIRIVNKLVRRPSRPAGGPDPFDQTFGVDTSGFVELANYDVKDKDWIYGHQYQPVAPGLLSDLLRKTGVKFEDYTFVDIGCGKGRAVIVASEFPFKRIVGVEFVPELYAAAQHNLQKYRNEAQKCRDIQFLCGNAVQYELPPGPIVLYLYNPFEAEIMSKVVDNVARSLEAELRDVVVLYVTPTCAKLWESVYSLEKIASGEDYCIYRSRRGAASRSAA